MARIRKWDDNFNNNHYHAAGTWSHTFLFQVREIDNQEKEPFSGVTAPWAVSRGAVDGWLPGAAPALYTVAGSQGARASQHNTRGYASESLSLHFCGAKLISKKTFRS